MKQDVIVVGGGIAGLTATAFLCKSGLKVLLCEKEEQVGGLIGSFNYKGFVFDWGIRAMENSGVLFPMLKSLDLKVDFLQNNVSVGIGSDIVRLATQDSIDEYKAMLSRQFPNDTKAVLDLVELIKKTMIYMRVLYGIDNPLFMDLKNDRKYLIKTLLPWMFKYATTVGKIKRLNTPIEHYLKKVTANQSFIDIIAQHFFKETPAFFALSYFTLYLDYNYPAGGTGSLITLLREYIERNGGTIRTNTAIQTIHPVEKSVVDTAGTSFFYQKLIWAADAKALYSAIDQDDDLPKHISEKIHQRKTYLSDKTGGDSVLTLYLMVDVDKSYFEEIHTPHFFYTPDKQGLSTLPLGDILTIGGQYTDNKDRLMKWVQSFLRLTTYEISIPVMRDERLAPKGKTGLIVSTLMDHSLVKHIEEQGFYDELKDLCRDGIIASLTSSIYPKIAGHIIEGFVSTPLTIEKRTGNTGGAITGWAFTNDSMPAVSSMPMIAKSIETPIPDVVSAGQWTYSPSGLPISMITGKLAADYAARKLKR